MSGVLNPYSGNTPTGPLDTPGNWVQLAAARNELTGSAVSLATPNPITVIATGPTFADGIFEGSAQATDANNLPLAYTVVSAPSLGGKITFIPEKAAGTFSYLPFVTALTAGTETFSILVSETTPFDTALTGIPLLGSLLVQPILLQLYQTPGLNTLLAPIIGAAVVVPFSVTPSEVIPAGAPAAFTDMVPSTKDGTLISTNFFPASTSQVPAGQSAPTILEGPGLGSPGLTDPDSTTGIGSVPGLVPGIATLRDAGYNVVTWDPRGEGASGGILQLDNPAYEGVDVSSILDYLSAKVPTTDDRIGMVGGSYGGGIQLATATIDPRIDAIVPGIAWNTLNSSLYPEQAFKTGWSTLLILDLITAGARINPEIYSGILTGLLSGVLTPTQQALLAASGTGQLVGNIDIPTLLIQGTVDGLFPLDEAVLNEQLLAANVTVPVKSIWFCGGHGICLDPVNQPAQAALLTTDTLAWLDQYVKGDGTPANAIPNFQWVDQNGTFHSSALFPSNPAFKGDPIEASGPGGTLAIVPGLGSGPQDAVLPFVPGLEGTLLAQATAAPADYALNLTVPVDPNVQIVGAPTLTFNYSGIGTSRTVYAQIVDTATNRVLGNLVTPIPVTLNGQPQTVSVVLGTMEDVAYTAGATGGSLKLQIVGSATQYANPTSYGVINISDVALSLPTVAAGPQPLMAQLLAG